MRGIAAALGALLIISGCGSNDAPAASSSGATSSTSSSATVAAPTSTARPPSPLDPDGYGAKPPTRAQLVEYSEWSKGAGQGAENATTAASKGIAPLNDAIDAQDVGQLKSACQQITDPLTLRLPAGLPSPDPDTTNVLRYLVEDGAALGSACQAMEDPPTGAQLDDLGDTLGQLGTDMRTAGTILSRNGDLLSAESTR